MCLRAMLPLMLVTFVSLSHAQDGVVVGGEGQTAAGMAPEILEEPTEEIVRRNDPLTLYCKAAGVPTPRILWYRTDSEIPLRDRDSRLQLPDGSLFFYRVRGRDRGTYYCVARSPVGTATSRRVTVQMAYLRENFRKSPSSIGVNEEDTAVFECDPPKGHPIPVVTWRQDGQALVLPRHRYRQEGTTLMLSHVIPADEGEYQCVVNNMAGRRISKVAILTVYESARVGGVVKSMVGVAGHDITLPCSPSGTPEPQVLWRRADGLMPVGRAAVGRDWGLTISSVRISDQGVYVCEASNSAGAHAANTSLLVVERPRVEGGVRPRIAVITPTHVRKISCPVTATPTPIVFWVKENHDRQEAERVVETHLGGGVESYQLEKEAPQLVIHEDSDGGGGVEEGRGGDGRGGDGRGGGGRSKVTVDHENSLHVSTHHEGLWACMAANEVGGLAMPVRVMGGGVARGTVAVGMVGVDEVEARASLLTPTLEQGYPASTTPTTATVTWRMTGRPTHLEGIFILGCERGSGFVAPRIHQQLQTHDISLHHHYKYHHKRRTSLPHQDTTTVALTDYREGSRSHRQHTDAEIHGEMTSLMQPGGSDSMRQLNNATDDGLVWVTSPTSQPPPPHPTSPPASPRCNQLRVLGHSPAPGRLTYHLRDLQPYTSYWFLLLPHYKGVLGVPSNLHAFTTPQDVPSGWAVLSRWWAARVGAGLYALTLHWRPLPLHLANGLILNYLVTVRETDTGLIHNVTVLGDLSTLTLPNITSSRVEVMFTASTVKGSGPPSPPARLNLLMTHFKDPGMGVGVVRSAWFLVLAGGAVAMVVMLVGCTVTARWCARSIHSTLPSELSKGKMCSVGGPWVEVGGLWTPVPSHDLNSDKSERKLLTSNASSAAEYAEVEVSSQVKDDLTKKRLEPWPQGYLCPSPSPSTASTSQRTNHITQTESLPGRPVRSIGGPASVVRQHTTGSSYTSPAPHTNSSTCRDSDTSTWYTGECCSCCREDVKLSVPHETYSATPSGCSTVLHVNLDRGDLQAYSTALEYEYSGVATDAYETVTPFDEAAAMNDHVCNKSSTRRPLPPSHRDLRHLRLNTESTTDLSMEGYNFSDDDDDNTQSCSDTEASFFIPHHRKPESSDREVKENSSLCDDIQRPISNLLRSSCVLEETKYPRAQRRLTEEERSQNDKKSSTSTLKCPDQNTVSSSTSNTSTSVASSMNPLAAEDLETSSTRRASCRSSLSQDSLEEQFERTLNMIAQGGSNSLDSDYLSASAYN